MKNTLPASSNPLPVPVPKKPAQSQSIALIEPHPVSTEAIEEQIRLRAYQLYQERGGGDGREAEDWLKAEGEVLSELKTAAAA